MATEAAAVNGAYDNTFNQPAELAASTPSHVASSSQSSNTQSNKADPQEIGWYFVEQYYTTLSKTPERIHLFYSKKSQLVTGTEAEKVVPAVGTKAISEKIKALDIQDCKVRVLNVDSQSSFDNIVVQVIGEMSNKSQPHHKFVQTFVLATQPNGYFVLNDIFRYLNDDEDDIVEDAPITESAPAIEAAAAKPEEPAQPKNVEATVDTEEAVTAVDEKLEEAKEPTVVEEKKPNGITDEAAQLEEEVLAAEAPEQETEEPAAAPIEEKPLAPEPSPEAETPPKAVQEQQSVPAAKKTWASLVGTSKPAIPALPTTTPSTITQPKPPRAAPVNQSPKPVAPTNTTPAAPTAPADEWQTADHKKAKGSQTKTTGEGIVHAYIKNVTEKVDARELRRTLEAFGELKYYDVSRPRNCAFVEFLDPAGYAAAVAANPHEVNGEPIIIEERRPRPGAFGGNNASFSRGGSNAGRGRGNFQKDAGRGGFQQRGGKSGNVTPKGRGQTQPA